MLGCILESYVITFSRRNVS